MSVQGRARLIFLAMFVTMFVCGVAASRISLRLGVPSLVLRNIVAILSSYLCFLSLIWAYAKIIRNHPDFLRGAVREADGPARKGSWVDWLPFDGGGVEDAGGCLVLLSILALLLLVGVWIGVEGPGLLIDEAFAAGISAGLAGKAGLAPDPSWLRRVFLRTLWPALLYLILSSIVMMYADVKCPGRPRLSAVVKECVLR